MLPFPALFGILVLHPAQKAANAPTADAPATRRRAAVIAFRAGLNSRHDQAKLRNEGPGASLCGFAARIFQRGRLILLFVVDKIMGLRVAPEHEAASPYLSPHGDEEYDFKS
jgi:hypothetical protein